MNQIPADYRVPDVLTEVDNSQANAGGASQLRALLCGEKLSAGTAAFDVPVLVTSEADAIGKFGRGSVLARMCAAFKRNNPFGQLWAAPLDDSDGSAAAGSIVFGATATGAGVISLYVGGQKVAFAVPLGRTATQQGDDFVAACALNPDLPVTVVNDSGTVTPTAKNKGPLGNFIDLRVNYAPASGEVLPAGVTVAITPMSGGATPPDLTTLISNLADSLFDFVGSPWCGVAGASDATSLNAWQDCMDAVSGRWSPFREVYGHVYGAKFDTIANLVTLGNGRNDPHMTVLAGAGVKMPTPPWEILGMAVGRISASIAVHPAQPTQTLELIGALPPAEVDRFGKPDRQTLLDNGIGTLYVNASGKVCIERDISTYQLNPQGSPDTSWLDSNTPHQLAYYLRARKAALTARFARAILVDSPRGIQPGIPIATPSLIAAAERAIYADMCTIAVMENAATFASLLSVTRDPLDANRVNSILPPDLANQLRVLAGSAQLRLQFPVA